MKIYVDHREIGIVPIIQEIKDCTITQLPIGDIVLVSNIGALVIERKTANDFIDSMKSNRLWEQLLKLMKTDEIMGIEIRRRLLVIQGGFWNLAEKYKKGSKFWNSIYGAILEITFVYDTPTILCENNEAFQSFIYTLIKREEKGKHDNLPKARWYRKSINQLPIKDAKLYLIDTIPLIGETHAKNLLHHYGSIKEIANSNRNELMKIPGIGKKRADKILNFLH